MSGTPCAGPCSRRSPTKRAAVGSSNSCPLSATCKARRRWQIDGGRGIWGSGSQDLTMAAALPNLAKLGEHVLVTIRRDRLPQSWRAANPQPRPTVKTRLCKYEEQFEQTRYFVLSSAAAVDDGFFGSIPVRLVCAIGAESPRPRWTRESDAAGQARLGCCSPGCRTPCVVSGVPCSAHHQKCVPGGEIISVRQ